MRKNDNQGNRTDQLTNMAVIRPGATVGSRPKETMYTLDSVTSGRGSYGVVSFAPINPVGRMTSAYAAMGMWASGAAVA